jgi:outer membrane usher protein
VSVSASGFGGSLGYNGSAVITRNGVLLGRSIGESFAIVDTGVPGVKVRHENRFAGVTNRNGLLLVPSVVPYADNKFEIDLDSMPLTAEAPDVEKHIVPHGRSGILVDFKVTGQTTAAILQLKDASGDFIPLSSEVILDGNPEPFVMGYDGEVYLTNLSARNTVTVKLARGSCKVEFDFTGGDQEAAYLGPLTCA